MEKRGLSGTRRYAMWKVHQRPQARAGDDKPGLQSRGLIGDVGRKMPRARWRSLLGLREAIRAA